MAAGYICGIRVGVSLLVGLIIGWLIILPLLALHYGIHINNTWSNYISI